MNKSNKARQIRAFCECSRPATVVKNGCNICEVCAAIAGKNYDPLARRESRYIPDAYKFGTHKILTGQHN